jgi:ribulose-bisphosphate carboxylase small chain
MSYIVNRPKNEPGFMLQRTETRGRQIQYTTRAYVTDKPAGERYK